MREESSSSPSAKLTVVSVQKKGAARGEVQVHLSDGSFFGLPADLLLSEGDELSPAEVQRLRDRSAELSAERRALVLLANAPHSEQALRLKLIQRGFPEPAVARALDRLREMNYLDDRRFAGSWVSYRLARHPEGSAALVAGLMKRGVPRALAEEAVREAVMPDDEERSARRAAEKLLRSRPLSRDQLAARLVARGFRTSLAIRTAEELLHSGDEQA